MSSNENARPDRHRKRAEAKRVNQPTKHPDQTQPKPAEGGSIFRPPAGPAWAEPSIAQLIDRHLRLVEQHMRLLLAEMLDAGAIGMAPAGPSYYVALVLVAMGALWLIDEQDGRMIFTLPPERIGQAEALIHQQTGSLRKPGGVA